MRAGCLIAPLLLLAFASCSHDHDAEVVVATQPTFDPLGMPGAEADILDFDIVQRTCALYVAVRSRAWDGAMAFGRDVDDSMIHWNMCPGGTMVACATVPTANGDTVLTGIPWPY